MKPYSKGCSLFDLKYGLFQYGVIIMPLNYTHAIPVVGVPLKPIHTVSCSVKSFALTFPRPVTNFCIDTLRRDINNDMGMA